MSTIPQPLHILLVEDSPTDTLMIREAFQEIVLESTLHTVQDGVEAMAFLHRQAQYRGMVRPSLVLLDLNLPRKNGYEVLAEIKSNPVLKSIPVIVLTTSAAQEDVLKAYELNANCFVSKPIGFTNFVETVQSLCRFWLGVVVLPLEN